MADYDWFLPSQKETEAMLEENDYQNQLKIGVIQTSTAVSTTFYCCQLCGAVLIHGRGFVTAHRERCFDVEETQGKHKL